MPRSIADIEQELEALHKDAADLRKEKSDWSNLIFTDPLARQQSLDRHNELMKIVLIAQNNIMEELKVLREKGMLLI